MLTGLQPALSNAEHFFLPFLSLPLGKSQVGEDAKEQAGTQYEGKKKNPSVY